jgi:hypothetical protein
MDWKAQRPAIEVAAEWIAAACFGGAIAFALWTVAPHGLGIVAAPVASALGMIGALFLIRRADRPGQRRGERFAPVDFTDEAGRLVLDEAPGDDEYLVLDDPLPLINEDSRVVRLFAVPAAGENVPLPAPGEMAARIENFLGVTRTAPTATAPPPAPAATDASAALHAALADIRRSLRQA